MSHVALLSFAQRGYNGAKCRDIMTSFRDGPCSGSLEFIQTSGVTNHFYAGSLLCQSLGYSVFSYFIIIIIIIIISLFNEP